MISDNTTTWQKVTVIIAVLAVVAPFSARYAWNVVFPANYLLYEATFTTKTNNTQTASVIIRNAGGAVQKNVTVYLPSKATNPKFTTIEISSPQSPGIEYLVDSEPKIPLVKYTEETGAKIPVGNIEPGNGVRVTLAEASKGDDLQTNSLSLSDVRVDSSAAPAIKADGIRYPSFADDIHSIFLSASPYFLAFILLILTAGTVAGFIFSMLFDTPHKQMARLWRQMDTLQEKIDKDRRYE